jgi:hypothetical protein
MIMVVRMVVGMVVIMAVPVVRTAFAVIVVFIAASARRKHK